MVAEYHLFLIFWRFNSVSNGYYYVKTIIFSSIAFAV